MLQVFCVMCEKKVEVNAIYNSNYRMHLCKDCGQKLIDIQSSVYPFKNPLVKVSKKYGYSMSYSYYRTRIYNMFNQYKRDKNLLYLIKNAADLKLRNLDFYRKRFVERELAINFGLFFGDEIK